MNPSHPNSPAPLSAAPDGLESLRQGIDALDQQLVDLLARRHQLIEEVARVKHQQNLATFHPAREENLISARRAQAMAAGLNPDYIEDLFRTVLRHSRVGQLETLGRRGVRPGARVLLVGGHGSMGRFFHRWFAQSECQVRILDREDWDHVESLTRGIDLCLLAVPIDVTESVAARIGPHLPRACVLADITSLKQAPLAAMLAAHQGPVLGLHPLFGPATTSMDKQIVVVTSGREPAASQWLLDQLMVWGNVLVETTAAEHDEVMGVVQALRHFATFAFGQFMYARGVPIARTLELSSPIYRLELAMVGRLFAQDPMLYAEIVFATPERRALLKEFLESLQGNLEMIEAGDRAQFTTRFREIADWFGPFAEQALRESTFLVEKLVHRF
ncbi:MAG TPA: bifunctional chorismate mutase/prephenate dehydrogenase [Verrucomicrobiota bacterium]|jgi:chorismate mutase/prephenate dehydrogenase|nr:MAG: T-protein [Verrucomicrobia bacterium ADurb.Bin118]HPY30815.1 bifunctional chorismate mutase/prephenate dehydrogenase [Verrucomicrobiota bacterium]HQB17209.1 bifunctional chorismate mutase/prephenate dehydrogenase [Verrucomicrobiota bacterium]